MEILPTEETPPVKPTTTVPSPHEPKSVGHLGSPVIRKPGNRPAQPGSQRNPDDTTGDVVNDVVCCLKWRDATDDGRSNGSCCDDNGDSGHDIDHNDVSCDVGDCDDGDDDI